ncbi:hypothetical protein GGS20DRAFT_103048 [Poronia punctata]|nr:hypothetical protein GGS20DRAFT_103048 [Poronia punctata]
MSSITLSQIQENPTRKDIFGILNQYINNNNNNNNNTITSASEAAKTLSQTVQSPDEGFFWGFWRDVFSIAEQIVPHHHPALDKLVLFVRELTLSDDDVWTQLPILSASIREHLDASSSTATTKVSFHAFVARLLHAGVSSVHYITALWMLRAALESDDGPHPDDTDLMIAAVYIEYAGATLIQTIALRPEPELDDTERRLTKGGKLWEGKSGLTADRWAFWGKRFGERAEKTESEEAKRLAERAARLIEIWSEHRLKK